MAIQTHRGTHRAKTVGMRVVVIVMFPVLEENDFTKNASLSSIIYLKIIVSRPLRI